MEAYTYKNLGIWELKLSISCKGSCVCKWMHFVVGDHAGYKKKIKYDQNTK